MNQPDFQPVAQDLFFTKNDPHDIRLGDLAKALGAQTSSDQFAAQLRKTITETEISKTRQYVIAGYPDDEGIKINGGRLGAGQAPSAVRKPLYKMTPALVSNKLDLFEISDIGDLNTQNLDLASRHSTVSQYASEALKLGVRWIGIGGGHDYGFPDAAAFIEWCRSQANGPRPLVINFDAHLDVRPTDKGLSSGTPFYRMLETYPEVDFAEIGLQGHCNSRTHLEWVKARGARILTQEQVEASGESFTTMVVRTLGDWILRPRPVFLSIDIDGFSSAFAPGCSQSWATGFTPKDFFPCLEVLATRLDVRMLSIYEVSPPLDQDDRTAKLAAQIIHRVLA